MSAANLSWVAALAALGRGSYDEAYSIVLRSRDDASFVRLAQKTGPVLGALSLSTKRDVLNNVSRVAHMHRTDSLALAWIERAIKDGSMGQLSKQEVNEHLDVLFMVATSNEDTDTKTRAKGMYNHLKNNARTLKTR